MTGEFVGSERSRRRTTEHRLACPFRSLANRIEEMVIVQLSKTHQYSILLICSQVEKVDGLTLCFVLPTATASGVQVRRRQQCCINRSWAHV